MIRLILEFFAKELAASGMAICSEELLDLGEVFRLDAKAAGDTVAIGGWRVRGDADTRDAEWLSLTLTRATAPWAFARCEPFRSTAS